MAPGPRMSLTTVKMCDREQFLRCEVLLKELLEGLYKDRLFPSLALLSARLRGRLHAQQHDTDNLSKYVTINDLIQVARMIPAAFEIDEDKSRAKTNTYSPILLGRPSQPDVVSIRLAKPPVWFQGFVDAASDEDPFPSGLWKSFELYLENLARLVRSRMPCKTASNPRNASAGDTTSIEDTEGPHTFKGTASEVASELKRRRLPFLDGLELGDIQHIVNLAFEKRKLLVRISSTTTVPAAAFSKSSSLAECAPSSKNMVRSKKELCEILQSLLGRYEEGVALSRLKEKIFETTNLRLEERLFECTKLLDVFRLPEVAQVCFLKKEEGRNAHRILSRKTMRHDYENLIFDVAAVVQAPSPPSQQPVPGYQQADLQPRWPSQHFSAIDNQGIPSLSYIPAALHSCDSVGFLLPPGLHGPEQKIAVGFDSKENYDLVLREGEPAYIPVPAA